MNLSSSVESYDSNTYTSSGSCVTPGDCTKSVSCSSVSGGRAKCDNYSLSSRTKGFTVTKRSTTCTSGSANKKYNGSALTSTSSGSCTNLVSGEYATFTNTGSQTQPGSSNNTIKSVKIFDPYDGNSDYTDRYNITYVSGKLVVSGYIWTAEFRNGNSTYISSISGSSRSCSSGSWSYSACSVTTPYIYVRSTYGYTSVGWFKKSSSGSSSYSTSSGGSLTLGYDTHSSYAYIDSSGSSSSGPGSYTWYAKPR